MPSGDPSTFGVFHDAFRGPRETPYDSDPASQPGLPPGFPDLPALPDPASLPSVVAVTPEVRAVADLRGGSYWVLFRPSQTANPTWSPAAGTLRLERVPPLGFVASGDLYRIDGELPQVPNVDPLSFGPAGAPNSAARLVPSFPRANYQRYFRVEQARLGDILAQNPAALTVTPLLARLRGKDPSTLLVTCCFHPIRDIEANVWNPPETAVLMLRPGSGVPSPIDGRAYHADFEAIDATGLMLGSLSIHWIAPHFREAVIEIDTEEDLPAPLDNGAGETWASVFERVGWNVRTETGPLATPTPPSGRWTLAELHDALLESRESSDLDADWRYHVSVVRRFAETPSPLGIAFDHEAHDLNGIPREGVAVQAGARLPAEPVYGRYADRVIAEVPELFFQISVHEIGHAMGLYHTHVGFGLLEQVDDLARNSASGALEAESLEPRFIPADGFRLRHLPDIYVRPGGTGWETQGLVEDRDTAAAADQVAGLFLPRPRPDSAGPFELRLQTRQDPLPIAAPLRVDFDLFNVGTSTRNVPSRLSLGTPFVRGWVVEPDGTENDFRSLFKTIATDGVTRLEPGRSTPGSATLLRGRRGALFARPGRHTVWLEVSWQIRGQHWLTRQRTVVDVVPPDSPPDRDATRRLLRTPETLGYLVLGRSPVLQAGASAIDAALDADGLRPHFAYVKAKAIAAPCFDRHPDWRSIGQLLEPEAHRRVLNRSERAQADRLRAASPSSTPKPAPVSR